jgi:osmotically-inducible protein OsmY
MKIALSMLIVAAALAPHRVMAAEGVRGNAATETGPSARILPEKDPKAAAAAVTKALRESREINASKISVATHASVVLLSGSVADEAAAARAKSIAEQASDGVEISSSIEVEKPSVTTAGSASAQVVRDVQAALRQDARTSKLQVTVGIDENQTVELSGLVPSAADRTAAQTVAGQVKGVKRVQNGLVASDR